MISLWEWCPIIVWRHRYNALKRENHSLRDALRNTNAELLKHRTLLAGLREGDKRMLAAVERAISS